MHNRARASSVACPALHGRAVVAHARRRVRPPRGVQGIVVQRQLEKLRQSSDQEAAAFLKAGTESESSVVWRTLLILLALLLAAEPLISNRYHSAVTNAK